MGFRVVEELKSRCVNRDITFKESSASGLSLLEVITGYDKLIIIDSIQTEDGRVGEIYRLTLDDIIDTRHLTYSHGINLTTVIELGKKLGEAIPQQVVIFAIEVADVTSFSEDCTPEVEKTIPYVTAMVIKELDLSL